MKRIFFLVSFLLGLIFVSGSSVQAQTSCFDGSSWVGPSGNPPSSNRTKPLYASCSGTQVLGGDTFLVQFGEDSSTLYGNTASGYNIRIQDTTNNPEIQLQYGTGSNDHWAIYNNQSDDSFRIWSYNSGSSADRLTVLQNGNVGIGTATPSKALQVHSGTSGDGLYVSNNLGSNTGIYTLLSGSTAGTVSGVSYEGKISSYNNNNFVIGTQTAVPVKLFTNDTVRLTVDGSGNVGIGDTTPSANLDVAGDILTASIAGRYDYAGTTFTPSGQSRRIYYFVDTGGESPGNYWKIATLRVTSDGYVGGAISGTLHWGPSDRGGEKVDFSLNASKSPGGNLGIQLYEAGASSPPIYYKYRQDAGGTYLDYIDIYVLGGWYVTRYGYIDIAGNVEFDVWSSGLNTGSSAPAGTDISKNNYYSIMSSRVGINTTSPSTQLDINGKIKIVDGTQTDGYVLVSDSNGLASWKPVSAASGAYSGYWQLSGSSLYPNSTSYNVGIGTTSPSGKLQVNGATRIIHSSSPSLYIQNDANSSSVYALEVYSQGL